MPSPGIVPARDCAAAPAAPLVCSFAQSTADSTGVVIFFSNLVEEPTRRPAPAARRSPKSPKKLSVSRISSTEISGSGCCCMNISYCDALTRYGLSGLSITVTASGYSDAKSGIYSGETSYLTPLFSKIGITLFAFRFILNHFLFRTEINNLFSIQVFRRTIRPAILLFWKKSL